jgi:hypothetical protein
MQVLLKSIATPVNPSDITFGTYNLQGGFSMQVSGFLRLEPSLELAGVNRLNRPA